MRKKYFLTLLSAFVLTLFATSARADVTSMADLFGTYTFTADVDILDSSFDGDFLSECEVKISKEHSIYDATITGLGGATGVQQVVTINTTDCTFTVNNPNPSNGLWAGAYFSNAEGKNPYYPEFKRDFSVVYTYNPETKEITMENFTVVKVEGSGAAMETNEFGTIVAKFTNVKMTPKESENIEINDVSGDWTFTTNAYDEESELPTTFVLSLESTSSDFKNYDATISFEGYEAVTTTATFNGVNLTVAFDSLCIDKTNSIFLANYQGSSVKGEYEFSYTSATTMTLSSGMSIVKRYMTTDEEGNEKVAHDYLQYYTVGVLSLPGEEAGFDWAGTYTVKGDTIMNGDHSDKYSDEFTFVVEYNETWAMYLITEFMGKNVVDVNNGGITFTIAEDGKSATIATDTYLEYNSDWAEDADGNWYPTVSNGRKIFDSNLGTDPLTLTLNEDGSLSLSSFVINYFDDITETENVEIFYEDNTVSKAGAKEFSWAGGFTVTGDVEALDGGSYPTTFAMSISYVETAAAYYVESFLGYDITGMTYGGLPLTIAEDGKSATMPLNGYFGDVCVSGAYPTYVQLCDADGGNSSLTITVNEDGTLSISDFSLHVYVYDEETWKPSTGDKIAAYTNVSATAVDVAAFNWAGEYLFTVLNNETYNYDEYSLVIKQDSYGIFVSEFMNYELGSLNNGGLTLTVSADDATKASIKLNGGYGGALLAMLENYNYLQLRDSVGGTTSLGVTLNADGSLTIDKFQVVESAWGASLTPVGEPVEYPSVIAMKGGYTTDIKAPVVSGEASEEIDFSSDAQVSVYDAAGRLVFTGAACEVNNLAKGLYIVKSATATAKLYIR